MPVMSGADGAVLAGPVDQGADGRVQVRPDPFHLRAELAGRLEERQVALLALVRGGGQELQQRLAGVGRAEQPLAERAERADPVQDDGGDQVVLGREVAEHGALAHARPPGDVGHRGVQAALGELVGGRGQQQRPVARRVSAQRARGVHQATITKLTERSVSR